MSVQDFQPEAIPYHLQRMVDGEARVLGEMRVALSMMRDEPRKAMRRKADRKDYGEHRFIVLGTIAGRLHVCIYTMRGTVFRIISLRKAKTEEVRLWQPGA